MLSRSNFIHLSRWVSAVLVLVSHLRSLLFKDYQFANSKSALIQLFYFITGLGHQAVVVFFVLSGYLIGRSVINQATAGKFEFKTYLISRVSRLYAVLLVALLLTVVLDSVGYRFDNIGIYTNKVKFATLGFNIADRETLPHFLTSLFMMQNIILPPLGSNVPLWSLNYEFFYYLLFPCVCVPILGFLRRKHGFSNYFYLAAAIVMLFFLPGIMVIYFLVWLLGLIPIYLNVKWKVVKYGMGIFLIAFLLFQRTHRGYFSEWENDMVIGILFTIWLCTFQDIDYKNNFYKINEWLASFSYTLYLVHLPFLIFVLTAIHSSLNAGFAMQPSVPAFGLFVFLILLTGGFSYTIACFTEFKTDSLKSLLLRLFNGQSVVKK
jgi:peptidoglycan/LPS O-acetylase OafA/YrhL